MEMWFSEFHTPDVKHSIRVTRHLYSKKATTSRLTFSRRPNLGGCSRWTATSC